MHSHKKTRTSVVRTFQKIRLTLLAISIILGLTAVGTLLHNTHLSFDLISRALSSDTNYYVSPTGSDSADGSTSNPVKSVNKAFSLASPGDTIILRQGEYTEKVVIQKSGTANNPITLKAAQGERVVLNLSNTTSPVIKVTGSYITLDGLEVKNSKSACVELNGTHITAMHLKVYDCVDHGIYADGQFITIEKNDVTRTNLENDRSASKIASSWGSAIKLRVGADSITIRGNSVHNNWGEGIAVTRGSNVVVSDNTFFDNWGVNIYIDNSKDVQVVSNFSYCTQNSGFERNGERAAGIALGEEKYEGWGNQLARIAISNNIVYNCGRGLISYGAQQIGGGLDTVTIRNNTFWNTTNTALSFNGDPSPSKTKNTVISNNIVFQPNGKMVWAENASGISFAHNNWSVKPSSFASSNTDIIGKATFQSTLSFDPTSFMLTNGTMAGFGATGISLPQLATPAAPSPVITTPLPATPIANTPTPAPATAPPTINSVPYVGTVKLRNGRVGSFYAASLTGYDIDSSDVLTLTFTAEQGPPEVVIVHCAQVMSSLNRREVLCELHGTPTVAGVYPILLTVRDNHGAKATQKINFTVEP